MSEKMLFLLVCPLHSARLTGFPVEFYPVVLWFSHPNWKGNHFIFQGFYD